MPAKNRIKYYVKDGYYHIYNRGTEKRKIFQDTQDYNVFLAYLKEYLLPKDRNELLKKLAKPAISNIERESILRELRLNNFAEEITLLSYCLMPNHFHFFIQQKNSNSMDKFMNSLGTRYTMYFNKKYKRVGSLYQGVYKAVLLETETQFLHLSRYIHKQALPHQPSSYSNFIGKEKMTWIHPKEILSYFSKNNPRLSYENFMNLDEENHMQIIKDFVFE